MPRSVLSGRNNSSIECVEIARIGSGIEAPPGIVYSTAPKNTTSIDGIDYVQKGPDVSTVVAELVAHLLAGIVGISTPDFAACCYDGSVHFLSKKIANCMRNIDPWLRRDRQVSINQICKIIIFDIWIMNQDRNAGNLLAVPSGNGFSSSLIAIDFEKSASLRGNYPLIQAPLVSPQSLWPTGELGTMARGAPMPSDFISSIEQASDNQIGDSIADVSTVMGDSFSWADSSLRILIDRKNMMPTLAAEVWQ